MSRSVRPPSGQHTQNQEDFALRIGIGFKGEQDAPTANAQAPLPLAPPQLLDIPVTYIRQSIDRHANALTSPLVQTTEVGPCGG